MSSSTPKKALLLMSGGVDSSYCAYLLQKQGYVVHGLYLLLHQNHTAHEANLKNIRKITEAFGMEHSVLDLQGVFKERVYNSFVNAYKEGLTPNPCALCNPLIKFGKAYEYMQKIGCDYLASGHYVQVAEGMLKKGVDASKDQSYFLYGLNKEVLPRLLFPLGERYKEEIKKEALKIPAIKDIARQKESQEICFVEDSYVDILKENITDVDMPGKVVDRSGAVIGTHKGYMHYTIGKRRGLCINGAHEPHYVIDILPEQNIIVAGGKEELYKNSITAKNLNLFIDTQRFACHAKIRYNSLPVEAQVQIESGCAHILLKEPVSGVAKGQVAAFYDGDALLGGGIITSAAAV